MTRRALAGLLILAYLGISGLVAQSSPSASPSGSKSAALRTLAGAIGLSLPEGSPVKCGLPVHASFVTSAGKGGRIAADAAALLFPRTERQASILRSGWRIHFDTTGADAPALLNGTGTRIPGTARAYAESVGTALSRVIAVECGGLGYLPPLSDGTLGGGPEPDLYIEELGSMYGMTYTDTEVAPGGTSTAFVSIDNDFSFVTPAANRGIPGMQVTVAHEVHHAIQLSRYGYWPDEVYYYEMTSTWLEDVVFGGVNDYLNYLWWGLSHFQSPDVSFTSNTDICYSRGIWCHFVAKAYGIDLIRRSWEEIRSRSPIQAIDAALRTAGTSFPLALTEWTRWNYHTAWRADSLTFYPEGRLYPPVTQLVREFVPPLLTLQGGLPPLAARYLATVVPRGGGGADTLTIAVVRTDPSPSGGGSANYVFNLRATKPDATYRETGTSLFASYTLGPPAGWGIWYLSEGGAIQPYGMGGLAEGTPFPNPFHPRSGSSVSIPVDGALPLTGELTILDVAMSRIHSSERAGAAGGARQIFTWDGSTDRGGVAPTGIYLYILTLSDGRRLMGKIAVVRP